MYAPGLTYAPRDTPAREKANQQEPAGKSYLDSGSNFSWPPPVRLLVCCCAGYALTCLPAKTGGWPGAQSYGGSPLPEGTCLPLCGMRCS